MTNLDSKRTKRGVYITFFEFIYILSFVNCFFSCWFETEKIIAESFKEGATSIHFTKKRFEDRIERIFQSKTEDTLTLATSLENSNQLKTYIYNKFHVFTWFSKEAASVERSLVLLKKPPSIRPSSFVYYVLNGSDASSEYSANKIQFQINSWSNNISL